MMRRILLLLLVCVGFHGFVNGQTEDSVSIYLPYGSDTTCPGSQLVFWAEETNDTAIGSTFRWYANDVYTGVSIDTFTTTALNNGDSVYCWLFFTNSGGFLDSAKSNTITIYRSDSIMPHTLIAITAGSNPDCPGHPVTFTAYPANGGTAPQYQWYIDNSIVAGATSDAYTNIFSDGDTVTVRMISNSTCAYPTDTAYSNEIEIIHDSLTAMVSVSVLHNPICAGGHDTFSATVMDAGLGSTIYWYVNGTPVLGGVGPIYATDTLHNTDIVYCVLVAPDPCVINDTTISSSLTMSVLPNVDPSAAITLTAGANPGCLDSPITFTAAYADAGVAPDLLWLVNDTVVLSGSSTFTHTFEDGDLMTFRIRPTDSGCYAHDSFTTAAVLMVRDSTPVAPLVSLIDNMLVANTAGTYVWYFNGAVIPGANAQVYHPPMLGYYYARLDTGNCMSAPSNIIYISLLDVKGITASSVQLFPNPTTGMLNIEWGGVPADMQVTICDMVGRVVLDRKLTGELRYEADLSTYPDGNYVVSLKAGDGSVSTHKILLSR